MNRRTYVTARRNSKMPHEEAQNGDVSFVACSNNSAQEHEFYMDDASEVTAQASVREASPDSSSRRKHTADEAGLPNTNSFLGASGGR